MKFNKSVTNPMLIGAIKVMKDDASVEHKKIFINEMVKAEFMAPVVITPEPRRNEEGVVFFDDNEIHFPTITDDLGNVYFMAFTDREEFEKYKPGEKKYFFACTYEDYFVLLTRRGVEKPAMGFVIDPFGSNVVVNRDMILNLFVRKTPPKPKKK